MKKVDYIGKTFGKLTVLSQHRAAGRTLAVCRCECSNIVTTRMDSLVRGTTTSCGCYGNQFHNKHIAWKQENNYMVGVTNQGKEFLFDMEDLPVALSQNWVIDNNNYVVAYERGSKPVKRIKFHRIIMNCPSNMQIDHINHITTDNRKCNLRICTNSENNFNKGTAKTNTSGTIGVTFDSARSKWTGQIFANKKHYQKRFNTMEEAIVWRKQMEQELFKEFAYKL
jgi:hypothetical protein